MDIKIFGPGCPKCKAMEKHAREAVGQVGADAEVTKIEDLNEMADHGVMITPALSIDGDILVSGRVASPDEIAGWIQERV